MTNVDFVLSLNQRDEIIKAVKAIERQVNEMADKSQWQALYVVAANMTIIRASLTNLPQVIRRSG